MTLPKEILDEIIAQLKKGKVVITGLLTLRVKTMQARKVGNFDGGTKTIPEHKYISAKVSRTLRDKI